MALKPSAEWIQAPGLEVLSAWQIHKRPATQSNITT